MLRCLLLRLRLLSSVRLPLVPLVLLVVAIAVCRRLEETQVCLRSRLKERSKW